LRPTERLGQRRKLVRPIAFRSRGAKGDADFEFQSDASGKITTITPYVVTRIWKYSDGHVKVEATMTNPPYEKIVTENCLWKIQDWFPAEGEPVQAYLEALQRAGAFTSPLP
jgi:hypothetical protein